MGKWIKNTDTVDHVWYGRTITSGSYYLIESTEEVGFSNNSQFLLDLSDGKAKAAYDNSGTKDILDFNEALNFLKGYSHPNPKTDDSRDIVAVNRIPPGYTIYPTGQGDAISAGGYGNGEELIFDANNKVKNFQMLEHWYGIGGRAIWEGSDLSDYLEAILVAPATVGTNTTGDFNKYSLGGGLNMYTPTTPGTGAWSLNLSETHTGTNVLKCVPVPKAGNTGYFDYNSTTNTLTVNSGGTGGYNLYDFDVNLFRFCRKLWGKKFDGAESSLESTNVVGKILFNFWKIKFTLNTEKTSGIKVGVIMITGAKKNI